MGSGGGHSWVVVVAHTFKEKKENRVESKDANKEEGSGKIPIYWGLLELNPFRPELGHAI